MSRISSKRIGDRGEAAVETWLRDQGWQRVARQWRCPWGELDLVMYRDPVLSFVEVKTRQAGSWDQGSLAVTATKQRRLIVAAQAFLGMHPEWSQAHCRFDVALVARVTWQVEHFWEGAFEVT